MTSSAKTLRALHAEIARCHARLEIDHYFVSDGAKMKSVEVPYAKRMVQTDGISCRDETIKILEEELRKCHAAALKRKRTGRR